MTDFEDLEAAGTADLLEAAQPNPLLRRVNGLCAARAWDELVELAQRCREAVERGKQLWPIAEHIDYRLALEAPGAYAAAVLTPAAGRFALGPLTEVAASTHSFEELAPHITSPQVAGVVAAERVVRGEDLRGRPDAHSEILELPMSLETWEPRYVVPTYKSDEVLVPSVETPGPIARRRGVKGEPIDDPELGRSLLDLVAEWVNRSNGTADVAVVDGPPEAAVGALGEESFLMRELEPAKALELMGWAGASGGAHGRRRGAALGRSAAWWAMAQLSEVDWPAPPELIGEALARLRFHRWEPLRAVGGWSLHLAFEDPGGGWSAAIAAEDRV